MDTCDNFLGEFDKLLDAIPDTLSLPKWQFAYRQVIYSMGLKILQNFPKAVVGPNPFEAAEAATDSTATSTGASSAHIGAGGHPSVICKLACAVLDVSP